MPMSTAQQNFLRELIFCFGPSTINFSLIVQIKISNFKERLNLEALKHSAIQAARRKDQMRPFRSGADRPISLDAIHTGNVLCKF
jgi:hypothetical protein